jgi:hypothetical protein
VYYSQSTEGPTLDTDSTAADNASDAEQLDLKAAQQGQASEPARPLETLDKVIRLRVSQLPENAKRLLEVVVVAGRPMGLDVIKPAVKLQVEEQKILALLRSGHLVRTRTIGDLVEVETYHDRIRETVSKYLSPEMLSTHHHELALALENTGSADPQVLTVYFQGAGENIKAAHYALLAADQATTALAFDTAARFYRLALELHAEERDRTQEVRVKLGDALSNAGRGCEAAEAYLAAAQGACAPEAPELQRRAASQFLMSGRTDEGLAVLRSLLQREGMRLAATPYGALMSLLRRRAWIRLRGLNFRTRDASRIPADELLRIDISWSVAQGLGMVDTIRAADFQALHLLLALRAGEKYRLSRAFAAEAAYYALAGGRQRSHTQALLQAVIALAEQTGNSHAVGLAGLVGGMAAFLEGKWKEARQRLERAEAVLRERCIGVTWELATARLMWCVSLFCLGDLGELCQQLPALVKNAEERGDLYEATDLRIRISHAAFLAEDLPDKAWQEVTQAIRRWSTRPYLVQHWWSLIAQLEIALYSRQAMAAWKLVTEQWPALRRSLLLRVQYVSIESFHHRACAALALAEESGVHLSERHRLLEEADHAARKIESQKMPWGNPLAHSIHAAVAASRGNDDRALALLHSAEAGFAAAHMALFTAATRRRRGELIGGEEGRALVQAADSSMETQNIRNPERMAATLLPSVRK